MKTLLLLIAGMLPALAKEGAVECGNLIYAGTKTSKCFSDEFLTVVQQKTSIATERRFKPVKLDSDELYRIPFVIMTGEGDFTLSSSEREHLKKYLESGGFLVASPSCSNADWSAAFEREIRRLMGADSLKDIPMDHEIFRTVFPVKDLKLTHGGQDARLRGITHDDKIVVVFSTDGLNDSSNAEGCCCCGGNEIGNAMEMNANILAYALLH
ncbi:DUF4159 domain-containing protein [Haloferula sargassicola]|uniref:DUF4159 domain-containing protein n=1 Tax=Haloferula sargassicola TaxID=490096 RepID=A0ABP9UHT6_9BACT